MINVLEHVPDEQTALRNIRSALTLRGTTSPLSNRQKASSNGNSVC